MESWPEPVREEVAAWGDRLAGTTKYAGDLEVPWDADKEFLHQIDSPLRMYHCTRLLECEVTSVRQLGLRALTPELVEHRISQALTVGALTTESAAELRRKNVFRTGDADGRQGQVCLILSRCPLVEDAGVKPLLSSWGGEALSMAATETRPLLESLGRPTVVVVDVDLRWVESCHAYPGVLKTFIATRLGLGRRGASVHYMGSVPPEAVTAVWRPGDRWYDALPRLPR